MSQRFITKILPYLLILVAGIGVHGWYFSKARPSVLLEQKVNFSLEAESVGTTKFYIGNDSGDYMAIADRVMMNGELSGYPYFLTPTLLNKGYEIFSPIYFRTPLYPLFIAAVTAPFATSLAEQQMAVAPVYVVPAQIVLHLIGMLILAYGLARFVPAWVAASVAFVVMFEPNMLAANYRLLAEALFCPLLAAFVALVLVALKSRVPAALVAAGVVAGLCALTKPIGAVLVLPLAIAGLAIGASWAARAKVAVGAVAVAVLVASPYLVRNYMVWGDFRLTAQPGFNFLFYNVRTVAGINYSIHEKIFHTHAEQFNAAFEQAEKDGVVSPGNVRPYELGDYFAKMGAQILTEGGYWPDYLRVYAANLRKHMFETEPAMFITHRESYDWKSPPATHPSYDRYTAAIHAHRLVVLSLGLIGLVALLLRRKAAHVAIFVSTIVAFVLASAPIIDARLALPEWILLAPFVAAGLGLLLSSAKHVRRLFVPRRTSVRQTPG